MEAVKGLRETVIPKEIIDSVVAELPQTRDRRCNRAVSSHDYTAPEAKQFPKPPQTGSVEAVKGFRETVIPKDIIDSVVTELSQAKDRAY